MKPAIIRYLDKDHCEGVQYYKLRQVDIDGNYSTSKPVAVNCKRKIGRTECISESCIH